MRSGSDARARGSRGPWEVARGVAAVLVCAGLLLSLIYLVALMHAGAPAGDVLGVLMSLVGYAGLGYFCAVGYRSADIRAYLVAVYAVAVAFFFKALMPSATRFDAGCLTLSFGLLLVFAERVEQPPHARIPLAATLVCLVVAALVALATEPAQDVPTLAGVLGRLITLTHVVSVATLALAFEERELLG